MVCSADFCFISSIMPRAVLRFSAKRVGIFTLNSSSFLSCCEIYASFFSMFLVSSLVSSFISRVTSLRLARFSLAFFIRRTTPLQKSLKLSNSHHATTFPLLSNFPRFCPEINCGTAIIPLASASFFSVQVFNLP